MVSSATALIDRKPWQRVCQLLVGAWRRCNPTPTCCATQYVLYSDLWQALYDSLLVCTIFLCLHSVTQCSNNLYYYKLLCLIFLRHKKNVTDSYIESVTKCLCCWQVRNSIQIKDSQWICTVATQDWKSCVCVEACFLYGYSKVCIVVRINGCHIVFW